MADMTDTDAINVIKGLARQFSSLSKLDAACERLNVLIGRESDLTAHVMKLTADRDGLVAKVAELRTTSSQLISEATAAEKSRQQAEAEKQSAVSSKIALIESHANELQQHDDACASAKQELKQLSEAVRQQAAAFLADETAHEQRLDELNTECAKIQETKDHLQSQLDDLKTRISPLLA